MRHVNIPIFIPHLGCPNMCVFCNQKKISGHISFNREDVEKEIENALTTIDKDDDVQIAFFGGSFTGIDREDMIYLLEVGYKYIKKGLVNSIRLSTRPDYIDREILDILKKYGVKSIELGLQSMDNDVLSCCKRGHTLEDSIKACKLIKEYGCFELVGQMMIALPNSTLEKEIKSAELICSLGADAARIYPTVVFEDTELEMMARNGEYSELDIDEIIDRTTKVLSVFIENNVNVIRIGLQSGEALVNGDGIYLKNGYHEAIGQLCYGEYFKNKVDKDLENNKINGKELVIYSNEKDVSNISGLNQRNKKYLKEKYGFNTIKVIVNKKIDRYKYEIITR